jgi:hypothetical protein
MEILVLIADFVLALGDLSPVVVLVLSQGGQVHCQEMREHDLRVARHQLASG